MSIVVLRKNKFQKFYSILSFPYKSQQQLVEQQLENWKFLFSSSFRFLFKNEKDGNEIKNI